MIRYLTEGLENICKNEFNSSRVVEKPHVKRRNNRKSLKEDYDGKIRETGKVKIYKDLFYDTVEDYMDYVEEDTPEEVVKNSGGVLGLEDNNKMFVIKKGTYNYNRRNEPNVDFNLILNNGDELPYVDYGELNGKDYILISDKNTANKSEVAQEIIDTIDSFGPSILNEVPEDLLRKVLSFIK